MRDFATPSTSAKQCAPDFNCGWSLGHLLLTLSMQAETDAARAAPAEGAPARRRADAVESGIRHAS
jgi:hypothetical protein